MTPTFFPFGVFPDEIPDPLEAARDFIEAGRTAASTTQWQWLRAAFTDPSVLQKGGPITLAGPCGVAALLQTLPGTAPVIPDDVGANANLWKIPYNRGYSCIDGNGEANGAMRLQWTSTYPELIWPMYSLQFIRRGTTVASWSSFFTTGRVPRINVQIRINGAPLYGTGPDVQPVDTKYRGGGLATQAAALAADAMMLLPPGFHTFEVHVAQASALNSDESEAETATYGDVGPTDGVCIGTREGWVARFPFGAWMGA